MQRNNIYRINPEIIKEQGFDKLASVYIPSIHKDYDTYTISYVFQRLFGTVCRIDRVANTTSSPDFQSVFVYYYGNNDYKFMNNQSENFLWEMVLNGSEIPYNPPKTEEEVREEDDEKIEDVNEKNKNNVNPQPPLEYQKI